MKRVKTFSAHSSSSPRRNTEQPHRIRRLNSAADTSQSSSTFDVLRRRATSPAAPDAYVDLEDLEVVVDLEDLEVVVDLEDLEVVVERSDSAQRPSVRSSSALAAHITRG